ncbi:hypothetical protein [Cupriavidus basilensis]|uniref:hypothetical protein n=1 Tax=Cupriavidus basilensis TaxID=68895 RepID=UPI00284C74BA|nr:hypothetical protein [Cupriavidus basilensis]MDR3381766.1 hypothetical protein [Cupriavidus basilensis]
MGNTTPVYSGEMKGNYYDIAECAKARQSKLVPGVRIELLHDKPAHEATVTWNHEFGALNAFVFKQTGPGQTEFKLYSAAGRSQSWIDLTRTCEQS